MNLVLLRQDELGLASANGRPVVRLAGRRAAHLREVLKVEVGDSVRVGVRGGLVGSGSIVSVGDEVTLELSLETPPPARSGLHVVLALPRPKALNRIIPALASLGAERIALINASQVDKSYWSSPLLSASSLDEMVDAGLEQAKDTVAPLVACHPRFRPFAEDVLPNWPAQRVLFHHQAPALASVPFVAGPVTLAIGPDGGWVPFELELLRQQGFVGASLGPRTLRVEVATLVAFAALQALGAGRPLAAQAATVG